MFTQVIIRKRKTDGRTTDGLTDDQRETIIPRHYCVAGYKKLKGDSVKRVSAEFKNRLKTAVLLYYGRR